MSQNPLINNTARAAQQRGAFSHALEILRAPFMRPWRAFALLLFVAAWPYLISGLVALTFWHRSAFYG